MECIGCTDCVSSCPVPDTMHFGTSRFQISPKHYALLLVGLFTIGTLTARIAGKWENRLSDEEIRFHIKQMNSSAYGHPGMQKGE